MDSGELKRRFGKHVQSLRETKGLTQEQLADRIGRSVDTIGNIERGVNATRIEVAYRIAGELGVSLPDLFAFVANPKHERTADTPATLDLLAAVEGQDEATISMILELVRVGLGLAAKAR